jgi:integrase
MQDIQFYLAGRQEGNLFPARKKKGHGAHQSPGEPDYGRDRQSRRLKSPNPKSTTGNINSHMLRHTFARLCKDSGMGTEATQRLMRHASFKTTYDLYGTMDFESAQKLYESQFLVRV